KLESKELGSNTEINKAARSAEKDFNELILTMKGDYSIAFRAYNEGLAYRFITSIKDSIKVVSETAEFNLLKVPAAVLQETDNYTTWEGPYVKYNSANLIANGKRATTPALFSYADSGVDVVIA